MFKEFPYYDRCKSIFDSGESSAVQPSTIAPAEHDGSTQLDLIIMKPEPSHMTSGPSSPTLNHQQHQQQQQEERLPYNSKRLPGTSTMLLAPDSAMKKKRRNQPSTSYNG
jgi:hypothetical protein